jgi:DNA modification methylase
MKLSTIKPNPDNPRTIKDESFEKLCRSITEFPKMMELRPIVTDDQGVVLGGNMRYKALQHLGMKDIPDNWVKRAAELTDEERRRFIVTDNVGFGDWDVDDLAANWDREELDAWGVEIDWPVAPLEAVEDDYEIPDEIETDIVLGDLFEIGQHRLLCGDSTDSDQVAKLMGGEKADMVFTDPPYDLINEDYAENTMLFSQNAHIFVMHDDKGLLNYLKRSQLVFDRFFVADFTFASPRGNDPYLRHILLSHEKNGNVIPHKNHFDGLSSIIKFDYRGNLKDEKLHDHQKSIEFISKFIIHYSNESNLMLDLFLGSGSTMVAAHQLNRKCYGMELDPKYCQVIVDRMLKLDPTLIIKKC